jgi:putative sugar O-methyltransferase
VVEVGGGFGSLGEILCGDDRNDTFYVDVDIPPTAVFSTYYLRQVFGQNAVLGYDDTADWETLSIEEMRSRARAAVLCSWQLPKLRGSIDLFVNFISFQEMEPAVVQMYLQHVDRLNARHVLLRNLREPLGVEAPTRAEDYDSFLPHYDLVASNTLPFGYQTPDGYHSELRLYRRR